MNDVLTNIFETKEVIDSSGNKHSLRGSIDVDEALFLASVIDGMTRVDCSIEVGCAYGIASLAICEALSRKSRNPEHIIIDPYQERDWGNAGTANLKRAGFHFFKLFETGSEYALPELASKRPGSFDFIFIDGWHTFDQTLLDLFYANRLLRVNGVVVIDDAGMAPVAKAISYFLNFPCYKFLGMAEAKKPSGKKEVAILMSRIVRKKWATYFLPNKLYNMIFPRVEYSSMVALQKTEEDTRNWNWYADF